jgi:hypothetical protein
MPRKWPKLAEAEKRLAKAFQIVSDQVALVERLKALKRPTLEAERSLLNYISALKNLEKHERTIRAEGRPKRQIRGRFSK